MNIARTLYKKDALEYNVCYVHDVVFAERNGKELKLQLVCPVSPVWDGQPGPMTPVQKKFAEWRKKDAGDKKAAVPKPPMKHEEPRFPLIVDVPGSGWGGAEGYGHVPYLVDLARHGFVAAAISYRGTYKDNVVFPAAVQDTKEAIRFLRANAVKYHIDPDRVGLLGDSSGGNTVSMAALTGDDEVEFNIGENFDQSSEVKACCNFYGPVDLLGLLSDRIAEGKRLRPGEAEEGLPFEAMEIWQEEYKTSPEEHLRLASPHYRIESAKHLPPFLFIQGEEDGIIPVAQGLRFCDKLREHGGRAEFVKVVGAGHGADCWSKEALELVVQFFRTYL